MHVPSGLCSVSVCVAAAGLSAGALIASRWLARAEPRPRLQAPALAALTAAVFAMQMLNMPVAGGTSGHLVGGALLGILAGPFSGLLAMCAILAAQAVLFADGGLDALGVNVLTMGVVGVLGGWAIHRVCSGASAIRRGISAGLAASLVTVVAAAVCAVALGLSGTAPTLAVITAMVTAHLPIALVEGLVAALVVALVARPDAVTVRWPAVAAVIACALAPFASSLPDGLERTAMHLGFADRATAYAAPFANYAVAGLTPVLAVIAAAVCGSVLVAALVRYTPRSA